MYMLIESAELNMTDFLFNRNIYHYTSDIICLNLHL